MDAVTLEDAGKSTSGLDDRLDLVHIGPLRPRYTGSTKSQYHGTGPGSGVLEMTVFVGADNFSAIETAIGTLNH